MFLMADGNTSSQSWRSYFVTAPYQAQTVEPPTTCASETRTCNNGSLSGSYQYASCTVGGFSLRPDDVAQ